MQSELPIKLVSTDFDGTLFAEFEDPPVPRELQGLIKSLQARGGKWVINTGRDLSSLMEALGRSGIEIEPDYLVLVEREIQVHHNSQYVSLEPWNAACHRDHQQVFARLLPDLPLILQWINARFHALIYEDAYSPFCLVAHSVSDMDQIQAYLEDFVQTVPGLAVMRNDVYARFCHQAYNKGTALAEITRLLGWGRDDVFAAGDHLNDLPMLSRQYARCLAAPANAVPAVKTAVQQARGYVANLSHGAGVAEAIKYYLADAAA
jgi:hydroxymethylpyrimidine pyrophosphatase-like HAD family hydrolase